MPYTANRQFKAAPRLLARAEGMYYWTADGRQVLDGQAGLWCVGGSFTNCRIYSRCVALQIKAIEEGLLTR